MPDGEIIDYTTYLQSIENSLSGLQDSLSDSQTALQGKIDELKEEVQSLRTESFFASENMDLFVPYANISDIANLLFAIVVCLGLIFGALVFRHFRK